MFIRVQDAGGFVRPGELGGVALGFLPIEDVQGLARALAVEFVVEIGEEMEFAVVDMNRGEEEFRAVGAVEGKGHGVKFVVAGFEFEDGEAEAAEFGKGVPALFGQSEASIEAVEIVHRRDEGGFIAANLMNGESRRSRCAPGLGKRVWRKELRKSFGEIRKEFGVCFQVDEANGLVFFGPVDREWEDHGEVLAGLEAHFVNDELGAAFRFACKDAGVANIPYGPGEAAHGVSLTTSVGEDQCRVGSGRDGLQVREARLCVALVITKLSALLQDTNRSKTKSPQ
jgi:hypothetical protein